MAQLPRLLTVFAFVVLPTIFPASASEQSLDDLLKWSVDKDGVLWVSPNPAQSPINPKSKYPMLAVRHIGDLFTVPDEQATGPSRTLWDVIKASGVSGLLNYFLSGGIDLASMTDAETHFRKLGLGLSDAELVKRLRAKPTEGLPPELAEREELDRLLAVRLCGARRIKAALDDLRFLSGHIHTERFLKDAAATSATLISGGPMPLNQVDFDLSNLLKQFPENISYLLVVRPGYAPLIERPFYLARKLGIAEVTGTLQRFGQDLTEEQKTALSVSGMFNVDQVGEMNYELARQLGNLRLDHIVSAGAIDPATGKEVSNKTLFRGIFPIARWRKSIDKKYLAEENGNLIYRPTEGGPEFLLQDQTISFQRNQKNQVCRFPES